MDNAPERVGRGMRRDHFVLIGAACAIAVVGLALTLWFGQRLTPAGARPDVEVEALERAGGVVADIVRNWERETYAQLAPGSDVTEVRAAAGGRPEAALSVTRTDAGVFVVAATVAARTAQDTSMFCTVRVTLRSADRSVTAAGRRETCSTGETRRDT